jgi:hypothetical protein
MDCSRCGSPLGQDWSCIACKASQAAEGAVGGSGAAGMNGREDRRDADRREGDRRHGDRRERSRQRPIPGGSRATDPPLTTRDVADWMGHSTSWVRAAIDEGYWVSGGLVRLEAETLTINGRRTHRVHLDAFIRFLRAIGWKRIPSHPRQENAA